MNSRNSTIDGIRGWASLFVMLYHVVKEMFGFLHPSLREAWFLAPLTGTFWVMVFFILSGDALSVGFFSGRHVLPKMVVKRYFRLTVPILLSCLMVYVIVAMGYSYHREAMVILKNEHWLGRFLEIDLSVPRLFKYSLIDVYAKHSPTQSFNPFLWTMSVEMVGSMMVFLTCLVWTSVRRPIYGVVIAALYLTALGSYYGMFFVGIILGYIRAKGLVSAEAMPAWLLWLLALLPALSLFVAHHEGLPVAVIGAASVTAVAAFYFSPIWSRFFNIGLSRYLGRISFGLYLVHFSVIISVLSFLSIYVYERHGGLGCREVVGLIAVGIAMSIIVAHGFSVIDERLMRFLDRKLSILFDPDAQQKYKLGTIGRGSNGA